MCIHLENHPRFTSISPAPEFGPATNTVRPRLVPPLPSPKASPKPPLILFLSFPQAELIEELFQFFITKNLLILPANLFAAVVPGLPNAPGVPNIQDRSNFFRATFAGNTEQIEKASVLSSSSLFFSSRRPSFSADPPPSPPSFSGLSLIAH